MQYVLSLFTEDPLFRSLQIGVVVLAILSVYLVFFVTRDIVIRTKSFLYQFVCIVLSVVPIVGFLLYLLIRPASTVREREMEKMLREFLGKTKKTEKEEKHEKKKEGGR